MISLLKMANLSCIHIFVEVFQSSEAYLEPCRASGMKPFCENFLTAFARWLFLQKCSIVDLPLGSKCACRVVPAYSIGVIRILA